MVLVIPEKYQPNTDKKIPKILTEFSFGMYGIGNTGEIPTEY